MAFRLSSLDSEAMRLASVAADQAERLKELERRALAAREGGYPGPTDADLRHARKILAAAEAAAEGARRHANRRR